MATENGGAPHALYRMQRHVSHKRTHTMITMKEGNKKKATAVVVRNTQTELKSFERASPNMGTSFLLSASRASSCYWDVLNVLRQCGDTVMVDDKFETL